MANGKNKLSDTVRVAVITLLASGTVFYALGNMRNNDADLHISSETYRYAAEGTHILTDTVEPTDDTHIVTNAATAETNEALHMDPVSEDTFRDADTMHADDTTVVTDIQSVTEASLSIETDVLYETTSPQETETVPVTVSDDTADTVYWVKNGEVWHVTDKCASLSRSKQILSGTADEAMASGKTRVCKRCGN